MIFCYWEKEVYSSRLEQLISWIAHSHHRYSRNCSDHWVQPYWNKKSTFHMVETKFSIFFTQIDQQNKLYFFKSSFVWLEFELFAQQSLAKFPNMWSRHFLVFTSVFVYNFCLNRSQPFDSIVLRYTLILVSDLASRLTSSLSGLGLFVIQIFQISMPYNRSCVRFLKPFMMLLG